MEMKSLKKILFPTDLSEFSVSALEYAFTLCKLYNAKLYFLHVIDNLPYESIPRVSTEMDKLHYRVEELAVAEMHRVLRDKAGVEMNVEVATRTGDRESEIIRFVEEEKIDLIVMATHGKPGISDLTVGSVAEKIVSLSTVPVLTVRPDSHGTYEFETAAIAGSFSSAKMNI